MLNKRQFLAAGAASLAFSGNVFAAPSALTPIPFTPAAFAAAQKAGKSIIVHVHASWCPTCAEQSASLAQLDKDPEFAKFVYFMVDFDEQRDIVRQLRARSQSTLIVFKGGAEVNRLVGVTSAPAISALLQQAV